MNFAWETWLILAIVAVAAGYVGRRIFCAARLKSPPCRCYRVCSEQSGGKTRDSKRERNGSVEGTQEG